jgi:hypothetical protein
VLRMIAVDVVVVVVLVIVTECDILPSHLQQTLGINSNTAAVRFLSDIKALCRLVQRNNVTHSTNRPHARRPSGGSDIRDLSDKIRALYYGRPPGVARKLVSAMLGFGKTRGHIPPQTPRKVPMQALILPSYDTDPVTYSPLAGGHCGPVPRASVAPHLVARHTMRPFPRSGASVNRYKKSR